MASKLKLLIQSSQNIIELYGMSYFIKIAISEFRKYGFDVFRDTNNSNELVVSVESDVNLYKLYIKKINSEINNDILKNQEQQFSFKPKFTIVIPINSRNFEYVESTINSIKEQIYNNHEIIILHSDDTIKKLFLEKFHITKNNKTSSNIKFISKINEIQKTMDCNFILFFESGDQLSKNALFKISEFINQNMDSEIIYADNDYFDENNNRENPFFKPDWSKYLFLNMDYLSQLCVINSEIFKKIVIDDKLTSALHYDIILRSTEITKKIKHISIPLCTKHSFEQSENNEELKGVILNYFQRNQINATVETGIIKNIIRPKFYLENEPLVSIIIPTKNNKSVLNRCITSIKKITSYKNFEIIIVDNNSTDTNLVPFYKSLPYKIINYTGNFNFSKMNNLATENANGDFILFLNDDTKILHSDWLNEMVSLCNQKDVGVVGAKLVYANNSIQHAGVSILETGSGFHPFQHTLGNSKLHFNFLNVVRESSAVTGACLLIKKEIFDKINRFDDDFDLYYGDTDLCLKVIELGYSVLFTPYARLLHEGSHSIKETIKLTSTTPRSFFAVENHYQFIKKWPHLKNGDPFYNTNLGWDYSIKSVE
tara:strand:+ start:721 stop:2517 length:1797 start_codon:yes stop_codon:yes gene_type:complete